MKINLNEDCFYNRNPIRDTITVSSNEINRLQRLVEKTKIYKLNGYHQKENMPGGTTYSVLIKYDSGESISISYFSAKPSPEVINAVETISCYFDPWKRQLMKRDNK